MSCEGRRLRSYYRRSSSAPAPTPVFTERSSASEKLVFKMQVIRRPDGWFLRLFVPPSQLNTGRRQ